jgi:WD40 repeat protein
VARSTAGATSLHDDQGVSLPEPPGPDGPVVGHLEPDVTMALAWSPSGARVAAGTERGMLTIRARARPDQVLRVRAHGGKVPARVRDLSWALDSKRLATAGEDGLVKVWNAASGREIARFRYRPQPQGPPNPSWAREYFDGTLAWALDGVHLAVANDDGTVILWDTKAGKQLGELLGLSGRGTLAWSPDGRRLAWLPRARGGTGSLWDPWTQEKLLSLPSTSSPREMWMGYSPQQMGHGSGLVRWSADGSRLEVLELGGYRPLAILSWDAGSQ